MMMRFKRIVVLTALPLEAAAVRAHILDAQRHDLKPTGTIVEQGVLAGTGYAVCLVCTGAGTGQAAVVAERVISWAEPTAVFFVGIAGALKTDIALGDVVAATQVLDYEGGKDATDGFKARPEAWPAAHRLTQVAQYVEADASWRKFLLGNGTATTPEVHLKPIASGNVVKDTDASQLATLLNTSYNAAAAIEMEAAGVARAAQHAGAELLVIRGISDRSNGTKFASDTGGWRKRAAQNAAAFAMGVIAGLPAPEPGDESGTAPADTPRPAPNASPDWAVLDQAPTLSWRSGLHQPYGTAPVTLEVHLVPVGTNARLQMARVQAAWGELVALGRSRGLFAQSDAVEGRPDSEGAVAFVRALRGSGNTGLALLRTGQRSTWEALPMTGSLSAAAIFDPRHLAMRVAALLELLLAIDAPLPSRVVPVAAIEPAMLVTRSTVGAVHSGPTTIRAHDNPVRTEATESIGTDALQHCIEQVAKELVAQLDQAFDSHRR